MRVLVVSPTFPSEQSPTDSIFVLRQVQALFQLGVEAQVTTVIPWALPVSQKYRSYAAIPDRYTWEGVTVNNIRAAVPPRMFGLELVRRQVQRHFHELIDSFKPHLIHAHFIVPPGLLVTNLGKPIVLTAHGSDAYSVPWRRQDLGRAARLAVKTATIVTAVSEYIGAKVDLLGRSGAKVIYNGADPAVFSMRERAPIRRELGFGDHHPIIVFAGDIYPAKGVFELADAVARLADLRPKLIVAGEGPFRSRLEAMCERARLDCLFLGTVNQDYLSKLFSAAHVIALPSFEEGLPAVVCEAMLSGRTVVATPVGGIPEILHHMESGILVPVKKPEALANALRTVIEDGTLRNRLERQARAFATKNLTWAVNAAAYYESYKEALLVGGSDARQASAASPFNKVAKPWRSTQTRDSYATNQ